MLCKIWGLHGGDCEECRLLGYKTPVRTSQETHYISATEPSRLMLCKIWGFQGCDCEEFRFLGCDAVWLVLEPTWRDSMEANLTYIWFASCPLQADHRLSVQRINDE
jgi:hypothetical protein